MAGESVCQAMCIVLCGAAQELGRVAPCDTGVERIAVQRRYGESIPQVLCFPARLNQVFLNVLQNAVQAIEDQGDIQVRVSASDDTVDVVISDTGRGISADRLADRSRGEWFTGRRISASS